MPQSSLPHVLGFAPLPVTSLLALVGTVVGYLALIELAKRVFFADPDGRLPHIRRRGWTHQVLRRAQG